LTRDHERPSPWKTVAAKISTEYVKFAFRTPVAQSLEQNASSLVIMSVNPGTSFFRASTILDQTFRFKSSPSFPVKIVGSLKKSLWAILILERDNIVLIKLTARVD